MKAQRQDEPRNAGKGWQASGARRGPGAGGAGGAGGARSGRTGGAQIFARLRADHRRVLAAVAVVEPGLRAGRARTRHGGGPRRETAAVIRLRKLVALLASQFETHLAAEDEVLFPLLARGIPGGEMFVRPLHAEHAELKAARESIESALTRPPSAARDEQLFVQARDLIDLLRIHIRNEEAFVFGVAERVLTDSELAELAARRTPGTGGSPTRSPRTRDRRKGQA
jgi:hemerythrin-like domain-containing protein